MRVLKIDHVGIAVGKIESIDPILRRILSSSEPGEEVVTNQGVRAVSYRAGESSVELLESTREGSPVDRYVQRRGNGIHHIALEVDDLEAALAELKEAGIGLIDETPRIGVGGKRIAFIHPKSAGGILIELCCSSAP